MQGLILEASRKLHFDRGLLARRYYLLYDPMSLLSPVEANQLGDSLDAGSATSTLVVRSVDVECHRVYSRDLRVLLFIFSLLQIRVVEKTLTYIGKEVISATTLIHRLRHRRPLG